MTGRNLVQHLPSDFGQAIQRQLEKWRQQQMVPRLWARDATLWTGRDEANWLGWLDIIERQQADIAALQSLAVEVRKEGFTHAVVLGMGGSSMCPEVMSTTFGKFPGFPQLLILDSTDPAQIAALEARIDSARTLFIVASKSGSTIEPNIFMHYFLARLQERADAASAARQFIAITDPGSKLEAFARRAGFRRILSGVAAIGGRYSALSNFGLVPAAVMGLDVEKLLARAAGMRNQCGANIAPEENPAVMLGAILGIAHNRGHDKLTLVCSPGIASLGAWLEQLIAESTGKHGKGIIPVDREALREPECYGQDRLFVYLRLTNAPAASQDKSIERLVAAGQSVVRIDLAETYDLGAEFFRWEMATATSGMVIGIDPFDQPDVESAKIEARRITSEYESTGKLAPEKPIFEDANFRLFADSKNLTALKAMNAAGTVSGWLRAHLARLVSGDYFCLLAFLEMNEVNECALQRIRTAVLDSKHVATCLGFGPRFLHSTGQAHKGGPASGVFLQLTCDDARDLPVPGQRYSFGVVKAAQAAGDFAVLAARGRRLLRVHLRGDVGQGLLALHRELEAALATT